MDLHEMAEAIRRAELAERNDLRYEAARNRERLNAYRLRIARHIDADPHGYLQRQQQGARARLRALLHPKLYAELIAAHAA